MSEKEMPAVEANSYELAFHVLPTVAEGEVATVFEQLKKIVTKNSGEITTEEAPARFDLAYEIVKYLEGRNRQFSSAYFGWIRFSADPAKIEKIGEEVEGLKELLRHLIIKLTKVEEENPFLFHEALEEQKVENIEVDEESAVAVPADGVEGEVSEEEEKETEEKNEDGEESEDKV